MASTKSLKSSFADTLAAASLTPLNAQQPGYAQFDLNVIKYLL